MKTILVTRTSAVALLATMSIALAQTPKGDQGQKGDVPTGREGRCPCREGRYRRKKGSA